MSTENLRSHLLNALGRCDEVAAQADDMGGNYPFSEDVTMTREALRGLREQIAIALIVAGKA